MSNNNYKNITGAATTTFAGTETKRVILSAININKPLTGTLVIKSGGGSGTVIGTISASTAAGEYWYSANGTEVEDLAIVNGSTEDVTVFYRNI